MTGWRCFILLAALVAAGIAPSQRVQAYEFKTLYDFCAQRNCNDGDSPSAGLVMDSAGNLYGTTNRGGSRLPREWDLGGTVFELVRDQATGMFSHKVLYRFCRKSNCTDGSLPASDLVLDRSGNLYGTALQGGRNGEGTVFTLVLDQATGRFRHKVLHSFCSRAGCVDGGSPLGGLLVDGAGNLYGTTRSGGASPDNGGGGTAFELVLDQTTGRFKHKVLHSFCYNCPDGLDPIASLIMDGSGNLYGTTGSYGHNTLGSVAFELVHNEVTGRFREEVLYTFCTKPNCTDGSNAVSGLISDSSGNLYGTTVFGGANGDGTVFKLVLNKATGTFSEKILYDFCSKRACADGSQPQAGLLMDGAGNLYGTTYYGGERRKGGGTVFELVFNKDTGTFEETVLYAFPRGAPTSSLIMDDAGNLYGTTQYGGANGHGSVFELVKN